MSSENLRGRTAAITGGGDGIGRALALRLAKAGMNLAVLDIRGEAAEATAADCGALGVKSCALSCDVSVPDEITAAAVHAEGELGPISLLWANAGLRVPGGLLTASREVLRWMFAVNVDGIIDTARAFVPAMRRHEGWRRIAITASTAGLVQTASGRSTGYCASKFASVGIAEALRAELAADSIGVTLFCPGIVNTRIWDGERARPERFGGPAFAAEEAGETWRSTGMDVDQVAEIAVEGVCNDQFYVVLPGSADGAGRIARRAEEIRQAVRLLPER